MDEYYCNAYPDNVAASATDLVSKTPFCPDDQYFNVEIEYTDMYVLSARKFYTYNDTSYHNFPNISKDKMMQETTIVGWLSSIGVPKDAHKFVVANVLECARDMANRTHKHTRVLYMRVNVIITRASEDDDDDDDHDDNNDYSFEVAEEDDGEIVEEPMEEDEDHGLEPATKSSIEKLEIVRVEEQQEAGSVMQGKCSICFEDFDVGVRMPCLHMFHRNCIVDWLQIRNSCPLCRLKLPTDESE